MPRGVAKEAEIDEVEPVEEQAEEPKAKAFKAEKGQTFSITQAPKQQRSLGNRYEAVARVEGTRPVKKFVAVANSADAAWDDLHSQLTKAGFGKASLEGSEFTLMESAEYNGRYFKD